MNAYFKILPWCLVITMAVISGCNKPGFDWEPVRQQNEAILNSLSQTNPAATGGATVRFKTNVFPDGAAVPIFHGFNWCDEGDNFSKYPLWLSGMTVDSNNEIQESEAQCYDMSKNLCSKMASKGFNCLRIPINASTMDSESHLARWCSVINGVLAVPGFYVILCYWPDGYTGGGDVKIPYGFIVEDEWIRYWKKIVPLYKENERVYFEPINEPHDEPELKDDYVRWLKDLEFCTPALKHRVILAGSGIEEYVYDIASDSRFDDCLIGFHMYDFVWWFRNGGSHCCPPYPGNLTKKTQWASTLINQYWHEYIPRVVITEFGCNMKDGTDYLTSADDPGSTIGLFQAICEMARTFSMGTLYWTGCAGGDKFSMFPGNALEIGNSADLQPQNTSGFYWLTKAFETYTGNTWHPASPNYTANLTYKFTNHNNSKVMGVRNRRWACLQDWDGANTQKWKIEDAGDGFLKIKNVGTDKYLDIYQGFVYDNTGVGVSSWNGGNNQRWIIQVDQGSQNSVFITTKNTNKWLYGVQYLSLVRRGAWPGVTEDLCMGPFKVENSEYWWTLEVVN